MKMTNNNHYRYLCFRPFLSFFLCAVSDDTHHHNKYRIGHWCAYRTTTPSSLRYPPKNKTNNNQNIGHRRNRKGLHISDVPIHDATRDLVLLSEKFEAGYKLTRNLEVLTDKLQQTYRELESEKRKTDRWIIIKFGFCLFSTWLNVIRDDMAWTRTINVRNDDIRQMSFRFFFFKCFSLSLYLFTFYSLRRSDFCHESIHQIIVFRVARHGC